MRNCEISCTPWGMEKVEIKVELHKSGLEAVAILESGPLDLDVAVDIAIEKLRQLGVSSEIDRNQFRAALSALAQGNGSSPNSVVIARGREPQRGIDSQIQPFFPIRDTPLEKESDPFQLYARNVTYPDETILQVTPPSQGIEGRSLIGAPLPAPKGTEVAISIGEGVAESEDGLTLSATTYGVILFHKGRVSVHAAVFVSEDMMEARITVLPDPTRGAEEQLKRIIKALNSMGITDGIDQKALASAVAEARQGAKAIGDVVAASGKDPVVGQEADYKLLINPDKKIGTQLAGGRIDFREVEAVKNVFKGEPLAAIIPGVEAVDGFRIDGSTLRAETKKATGAKPGQNTMVSEDGVKIVADADGMVVIKGNLFHVVGEYLVQNDIDYRTGNIRASGSVQIRGNVKPGFQVESGKDVEILKDVEEAIVKAKGNVEVKGGVMAESKLYAEKNIIAKYVLSSRVECGGDLEVKLSIANSHIYVKGKVKANGPQGTILGGEVNAAMGIEARTIGSSSSTTHVAAGVDLRLIRELEEIDKERAAVLEGIKIVQSNLGQTFLKDPRAAIAAIPPSLRKTKLEGLQKMQAFYQKDSELTARRDKLAEINREQQDAQISVQGQIFAGTHVTISLATLKLPETLNHVLMYYDPAQNRVAWRRL